MRKNRITSILILILNIFMIGCTSDSSALSNSEKNQIKNTIDLVLSYKNGYDDTMKKHISEKNFYVCNYIEFYSAYIGEVDLKEYESNLVSIREEQDRYIVCMTLDMNAVSSETHTHDDGSLHEEGSDEAVGEDVPIEVILKQRSGELYIEGFTEYENLEKAKELNEGFK
ncbi:hypothetical protein R0131_16070 [Clostridium sp. AL.422]|uniref:hypothetical protein n=1 Tax=Clostridium TaxID=1485 RepID=UPI00293DA5DF|nr:MULTISPECIES: hypothetical protein [unclassified Clostridium]MDV4152343.1 hypothetical protein [Clostridium sp. AL.422]